MLRKQLLLSKNNGHVKVKKVFCRFLENVETGEMRWVIFVENGSGISEHCWAIGSGKTKRKAIEQAVQHKHFGIEEKLMELL